MKFEKGKAAGCVIVFFFFPEINQSQISFLIRSDR